MILRAAAFLAWVGMAAVAVLFASLSSDAVPRLECDWGTDFCSDYGLIYAGLAFGSLVLSLLFFFALRARSRK